ncbi:hypothetical protein GCM10007382_14350 [Salinibacterium xinjiangense]|nr:hypothetical protein GCM10007382_14350 [Salinibacterium xinjiangense]
MYCALIGGYEQLLEQPAALESSIPFICLTDDPTLTSETWDVRLIQPEFPLDRVRSARVLKIRGHELLDEFQETLWLDNTVAFIGDPGELLDEWLVSADLAVPRHSFRENVSAEFAEVVTLKLDDPARIFEQWGHYMVVAPLVLASEVLWTGMLARRSTVAVRETMAVWLDHVLRYSRRDQLSVGIALATARHEINIVAIENSASRWHEWPRSRGRNILAGERVAQNPLEVLTLELEQAYRDLDAASIELVDIVKKRESRILECELSILDRESSIRELEASTRESVAALNATLASGSWRITAPYRWSVGRIRRMLSAREGSSGSSDSVGSSSDDSSSRDRKTQSR